MKQGFTLSEVLITLSIVGIIAVLTIPGIMRNYKNRLYTAQLQKVYAQITDANQALMNDNHVDNFYESKAGLEIACNDRATGDCQKGVGYYLNTYFKPIKRDCLNGTSQCFSDTYTTIDGEDAGTIVNDENNYSIQTTTGAAICASLDKDSNVISILVDVNGAAQPNVVGRDIFSMEIKRDGTVSDYGPRSNDPSVEPDKKVCDGEGETLWARAQGCLTSIIEAGWKMEY